MEFKCHLLFVKSHLSRDKWHLFCLITAGDDDAVFGGFAADHVGAGRLLVGKGHATDGGLRLFLDLSLGLGRAVPMAEEETAVLHLLLELLVVVALVNALVAILASFLEDVLLDILQQLLDIFCDVTACLSPLCCKPHNWSVF